MSFGRLSTTLLLIAAAGGLSACGTKQTLEQAIKCDQFARSPDGAWSTKEDVSLDYLQDGTETQTNFSKGLTIDGKQGKNEATILAALEKKCATKP